MYEYEHPPRDPEKVPQGFMYKVSLFAQTVLVLLYFGAYKLAMAHKPPGEPLSDVVNERSYQVFRSTMREGYATLAPLCAFSAALLVAALPMLAGPDWEAGNLLKNTQYAVVGGISIIISSTTGLFICARYRYAGIVTILLGFIQVTYMTVDPVHPGYCRILMNVANAKSGQVCGMFEIPVLICFNMCCALFIERRFERFRINYIVGKDRLLYLEKQYMEWSDKFNNYNAKNLKLREETDEAAIRALLDKEKAEELEEEEEKKKER